MNHIFRSIHVPLLLSHLCLKIVPEDSFWENIIIQAVEKNDPAEAAKKRIKLISPYYT